MRVAVTGAAGQLGTLVLRRLIDDRTVKGVIALDLRPPLLVAGKLTVVQADVRDPDFARHLGGCDALVHLAFVVTQHLPRATVDAINVGGSANVFRAAHAAGVGTIVYTSSVAAYGVVPGHPVPIVEDTPRVHQPDFAYAATKFQVEAFLDDFERAHPELAVARLRPAILIGGRMEHPLGRILRRRVLFDAGGAPMPLVWDGDVADAVLLALQRRARGAFNLAADEPADAATLARATGMRVVRMPRVLVGAVVRVSSLLARVGIGEATDPKWVEVAGVPLVYSSARARAELGWTPRHPTCVAVMKHFCDLVPDGVDRRIAVFMRLVSLAARREAPSHELRGMRARVHLSLTGAGGGDFGITIADGRLRVGFAAPRPPTSVVTLRAALFRELLAGKSDLSRAQLTGRVRIEGEPVASLLLGGMITSFRSAVGMPGPIGALPRLLSRWLERGGTR